MRLGLSLVAATVAAMAVGAPASAAESGLGLTLAVGAADPGPDIPIELTVVNRGTAECQIAAMADGTVRVTGVTRDGQAVSPASFGEVVYLAALSAQAEESLRTLAPGGEAKFGMAVAWQGTRRELSTVDALPGGSGVASNWAFDAPGRYHVKMVYSTPQTVGKNPCRGVSSEASAEFTIDDEVRGAAKPVMWWWIGAAAAVILIGLTIVLLLRRRRGPAAAALVLVCVASGLVSVDRPAHAEVSVMTTSVPGEFLGTGLALTQCMNIFRAPGGDPAQLLPVVDAKPGPNIKVRTRRAGDQTDAFVVDKDGNQIVYWDHNDKTHMLDKGGLTPNHPGTLTDPCAELYHELAHAKEYNSSKPKRMDKRPCDHLFIETTEAAATLAENQYRLSRKPPLDPRHTYSGRTLPKNMKDCEDRPPDAQKHPTQCTQEANAAAGTCADDVPPEPNPNGGGRPGMSNGDPHLITLDGRPYDFQAVGEFVAVASASGDLQIQTRQAPVPGSRWASLNSAVALKVGPDRLQLAVVGGDLVLWVNGKPEQWAPGARTLPGGARAARRPSPIIFNQDGYTVRWPDGSLAWIDIVGQAGLRLYVLLAPARKGAVRGLLGDFDGTADNDLVPRGGGTQVGELTREALYGRFGDSWRVGAAESLFVYGPGESTETFTDRAFPEKIVGAPELDPARREAAQAICAGLGITNPVQLDACILDVALTGQPAFAVNTLDIQSNPAFGGTSTGGALRDGDTVSVATDVQGSWQYTLDLGGAREFFVADWRGTSDACDQAFFVNLVDVSHGNQPCTGGFVRFRLPDPAKAHRLEIVSKPGQAGNFRFRIVTVKPRTFSVALGASVSGVIDVRGREDVHEFDPAGAGAVQLTGLPADCSAGLAADLFDITDNRIVAAGRLLCGTVQFTLDNPAHRHAIVVASTEVGTGGYSFTLQRG